jgi:hypothetical protein
MFLTAKRSTTQNARTWRHDGRKDRPFRSHVTIVILDLRVDGRTVVCTTIHAQFPGDPASSHMLVSKIKPCMSQYKPN